tara:strand:- start:186 stop:338 length:153 start_codon:yes stop_codon:yes gene_type:complete
MTEWIQSNWEIVVIIFFVIEKIIRISPTKSDDILLDMVLKPLYEKMKPKK